MVSSSPGNDSDGTRQEKREKKQRKKRERMKQHGKDLAQMYKDAIEKRKQEK
jgi:hypothetical protein